MPEGTSDPPACTRVSEQALETERSHLQIFSCDEPKGSMTMRKNLMKSRLTHSILIGACTLGLWACEDESPTPDSKTVADSRTAADAAADLARKTSVSEFKTEMVKKIEAVDEDIAELEARGADLAEEARVELDAAVRSLKAKRDDLSDRLSAAKTDTKAAWNETRDSIDDLWDDLEASVQDALGRFGS